MYAKIFGQIFDSSIADDYELRHFFMDLLVLADVNGVVNMTPSAISARTRIPIQKVNELLPRLEASDSESQSVLENGARIRRLDDHRTWGWEIVNYLKYRAIASEEQRREGTKLRTRKWRDNKEKSIGDAPVTQCDAVVTQSLMHMPLQSASSEGGTGGRFQKPTMEQLNLYATKIGLPNSEASRFFDHYESNGWKVSGRSPMRNWEASMRNWKANRSNYSPRVLPQYQKPQSGNY